MALVALTLKCTCIVSIAHVMFGEGCATGHAAVAASDEKETVPELAYHSVTAPPVATFKNNAFTAPVPIDPLSDVGAVAVVFCANPLTSTRLTSASGSSIPNHIPRRERPARPLHDAVNADEVEWQRREIRADIDARLAVTLSAVSTCSVESSRDLRLLAFCPGSRSPRPGPRYPATTPGAGSSGRESPVSV